MHFSCAVAGSDFAGCRDEEGGGGGRGKAADMKCELANLLIAAHMGGTCTHMFPHHVILQNVISSHKETQLTCMFLNDFDIGF